MPRPEQTFLMHKKRLADTSNEEEEEEQEEEEQNNTLERVNFAEGGLKLKREKLGKRKLLISREMDEQSSELLMTELPLIHRPGHHYPLHQPHLAISSIENEYIGNGCGGGGVVIGGDGGYLKNSRSQLERYNGNTGNNFNDPNPATIYIRRLSHQIRTTNSSFGTSTTNVSSLYPEILALIFSYLEVRDKGRAAQVCTAWRDAAYYRSVWRGVEARLHLRKQAPALFSSLVRRGVKRVQVLSLRRGLIDVLKGVPNLESLNLSGCYNLTDTGVTYAFYQDYPSLTELNLSLCKQVTDASLGRISQFLKNLEQLELGGCCNITNTGLLLIAWGLKKLKRLDLRSCWHISDPGIAHLAGLNPDAADGNLALEHLSLQDCQRLSDEGLRHLSLGLTTLKSINLSFCVCITDWGVKHLARMNSLRELNLRSCDNISDTGIAYLAEGGSSVASLDVSFCDKIGDQALIHISQGLFNLRCLSLSACQISDDGVCEIAKTLHELETLNIGQCHRLTDRGLFTIADSMKRLKCIDLYGCTKITSKGLQSIMKLPRLSTLNLGL